jgi:predicted ATPase
VRRLIECAALLGYRFDANVLAACCHITEAAASCELQRACRSGLLVCEVPRVGRYRFVHGLYRSAIRDGLDPRLARALHARIAATLERLREAETSPELLAHHWRLAGVSQR